MTLLAELRRRKVFKVGAAYVVIAWIVVQVASIAMPAFDAPPWVLRVFILVLMLGFPIALVMAWVFDVTPEGVRAETGRRGNTLVFIAAAALTALALGWYFKGQPSYRKDAAVAAPASAPTSATAAAPIDSTPSIAVLPFANLGGKADDEYFSDGMTEELLNVLARNTRLKVAARTSVFQYKDRGGDVREIGRTLGVGHIVEGSVRRDGERVRVTAQLIRVADGFHVWSQTWDRELKSVFALQDEIAQSLAQQLDSTLGGDAKVQSRQNVDPAAYDDFLRARALYRERRNTLMALQLFRSAVARDPQFAAAWANLALACEIAAYHATAMQQRAAGDRIACMREATAHATELAPGAAITLHAQANLARSEGRFVDAERLCSPQLAPACSFAIPSLRQKVAVPSLPPLAPLQGWAPAWLESGCPQLGPQLGWKVAVPSLRSPQLAVGKWLSPACSSSLAGKWLSPACSRKVAVPSLQLQLGWKVAVPSLGQLAAPHTQLAAWLESGCPQLGPACSTPNPACSLAGKWLSPACAAPGLGPSLAGKWLSPTCGWAPAWLESGCPQPAAWLESGCPQPASPACRSSRALFSILLLAQS